MVLLDGIEKWDGAHLYGSDSDTGGVGLVGFGSHQVLDVGEVSEKRQHEKECSSICEYYDVLEVEVKKKEEVLQKVDTEKAGCIHSLVQER